MVHLATLVHDDVMDEAAVRRRRPTLAVTWGNQISVLLGDALFAHALKLAAGFPTTEVCRAVSAATKTVCSGEILQTMRQRKVMSSREEYFRILQMKTAELFALSCELGAWLGGATAEERAALKQFGLDLGTAYQIYDDCLDIFGSEVSAGKSLGTDLLNGKTTLPVLVALEQAEGEDAQRLRHFVEHWEGDRMPELFALLAQYGALSESQSVIHGYLQSARTALRSFRGGDSRTALLHLVDYLAAQTDGLGRPCAA
jgi:octaprenyl-diphosphate synthase